MVHQVEDAQGRRLTPEAMACTILTHLQVSTVCATQQILSPLGMVHVTGTELSGCALWAQSHGYLKPSLANNAVNGPTRAIADWAERKVPVLDYSI